MNVIKSLKDSILEQPVTIIQLINGSEEKNHIIILINSVRALNKTAHPFLIKILGNLNTEKTLIRNINRNL